MKRKFAEGTVVSAAKSRAEIEDMLSRYGADQFASGTESETETESGRAVVVFGVQGRRVRFVLPIPRKTEKRFTQHPRFYWKNNSQTKAFELWEAENRRLWRALALVIKAKLEAVSSGIVTFESEFLAHFVVPGTNHTVGEEIGPQLLRMHEKNTPAPLLLGGAA